MSDPHVEKLIYRIETEDGITFQDPPPIEHETDAFRMTLENGIVTFSMKEHHPTEHSARQAVAKYLRSWELDVALRYGRSQLHFVFDRSNIVDRNPPPPGTPAALSGRAEGTSSMKGDLTVPKTEYPQPPRDFVADSDVTVMWERYQRYTEGREPLLTMAYWCLTLLQDRAPEHPKKKSDREKAASIYRVHPDVLDTLGCLSATLGDEIGARKHNRKSQRELIPKEVRWIEDALKLLIRRAGQYAADPYRDWPKLSLDDLPDLDSG